MIQGALKASLSDLSRTKCSRDSLNSSNDGVFLDIDGAG